MTFHRIVSAQFAAPLVGTEFASHPANQCVLPSFLALLIDLPPSVVFYHRAVLYGRRPTIFILSSEKPDPPFSDLSVHLSGYPFYVHLFPPIPVSRDELSKAAHSTLTVQSSDLDSVIAVFKTTLPQRLLSLSRTAFPVAVDNHWDLYPVYLSSDTIYPVSLSATLPNHNPHHRDICTYLSFRNGIRAEFSSPRLDVTLRWLRHVRTTPRLISSFSIPKPPLCHISVLHKLYALQDIAPPDNYDVDDDSEVYETLTIPAPVYSPICSLIVLDVVGMLQDRMSGLQSLLGVPYSQRLLELEFVEFSAGCSSYSQILSRSLNKLAAETSSPAFDASRVLKHLMRTREAIDEQYSLLLRSGIPIIGFSTVDRSSLIAGGFTAPPWLQWIYVSNTADGLYRRCTRHAAAVLEYAQATFHHVPPSQILFISPSLIRCLLPALQLGMGTVLPDCPHDLELQAVQQCRALQPWREHIQPLTQLLQVKRAAIHECTVDVIQHVYCLQHAFHPPHNETPTSVIATLNLLNNQMVVIKYSNHVDYNFVIERESLVYAQLGPSPFLPRVLWHLPIGNLRGLCLELLGPSLEDLRKTCRGLLSHRAVVMVALRLLSFLQFAHSAGIILRDLKAENLAVGLHDSTRLYVFDFDTSQSFVNPTTGQHLPYAHAPSASTYIYSSHWAHADIAATRRDDIAMLGHLLIRLFHGLLPWESLTARTGEHYVRQLAYMKTPGNLDLHEAVVHSPRIVGIILSHAHGLRFDEEPAYQRLIESCRAELAIHGWQASETFDWSAHKNAPLGTLLPEDFCFFAKPIPPLLGYA